MKDLETLNQYQQAALTTDAGKKKNKGSYFPDEVYNFSDGDNLPEFVRMLKARNYTIGEDGHIRSFNGKMCSKLMRNGYYMTSAQYNKKIYYFMEHRVVWVWYNGAIPPKMQVNHKDYNTANNHISNLELMTSKENVEYSRCHFKPCRGEKSPRALCTNKQAQAIKTLATLCGWKQKQIEEFSNVSLVTVNRIINGTRYPDVISANDVLSIYPTLVDFTRNKDITPIEELKNYSLGLCGEAGEVVDYVKKYLYHGKDFDPIYLILELGDVLYYIVAICNVLGFDFDEIMLNNNAKLLERYKGGYAIEKSLNRVEDKGHGSGDYREQTASPYDHSPFKHPASNRKK